jgi:hypothetical protein
MSFPNIWTVPHLRKDFQATLWFHPTFWGRDMHMYLVFLTFTTSITPPPPVATKNPCSIYGFAQYLTQLTWARSPYDPLNISPSCFFLTFRMTYSKTKLEVMAVKHLMFQTTVNRVRTRQVSAYSDIKSHVGFPLWWSNQNSFQTPT